MSAFSMRAVMMVYRRRAGKLPSQESLRMEIESLGCWEGVSAMMSGLVDFQIFDNLADDLALMIQPL